MKSREEYLEYLIRIQIEYCKDWDHIPVGNLLDSNIARRAGGSFANHKQGFEPATFKELKPVAKRLIAEAMLLEVLED